MGGHNGGGDRYPVDMSKTTGGGGVTDEQLLGRLLSAPSPKAAMAVLICLSDHHASNVLRLLLAMQHGAAALAALLQHASPVIITRCVGLNTFALRCLNS